MSHPTLGPEYMDSLVITTILRERGPLTYHDLLVQACIHDIDATQRFDKALILALSTDFVKGQFAACTPEEKEALRTRGVHPTFDKPDPEPEPEAKQPLPRDEAMFKLIQQRSDWIKAGRNKEED